MQDSTPETWQARADRLGIRVPTIARATGANVFTVRAYKQGRFKPSAEWLAKVERLLSAVEGIADGEATA
jgi:hypothetical protein